jgi:coproporphyrinogen III oxidase-like Fe-S oxidoreductase
LGIESIKQETLDGMKKRTTEAGQLVEVIRTLRELGISFSFNLIFGWDTDHTADFQHTLAFLKEHKVHAAFFNSFAPHKGTKIYERLAEEGRILDSENMDRWPGIHAKIRPRNFSAKELHDGIKMMYRSFYSWPSILRRLPPPISAYSLASWSLNLSQRKFVFGKKTNFDSY